MKNIGIVMVFVVTVMAAACDSRPVCTTCDEEGFSARTFLLVNRVGDSSGMQPQFSIMTVGEAAKVMSFRFIAAADAAFEVAVPEGCDAMYEDDPSEHILVIGCYEGIEVPADSEIIVAINLTGPWWSVKLMGITAEDEFGNEVYNDLSSDQPILWNNPDPPTY